jgi:AcrR family transcriptional regulator
MQYEKEEIRKRILSAARAEFLENGFEGASVRAIAAKAQTAKSNLYNYFSDKGALFSAVLEPTVQEIRNGLELAKRFNAPKEAQGYTFTSQQMVIGAVSQFTASHQDEVKLLLFKAQGSSLEGFKQEVLDNFTDNMHAWTQSIRGARAVSRLFVRSVCSFYLNMIEQLYLVHPTAEEVERCMGEIAIFVYHGWKNVLSQP